MIKDEDDNEAPGYNGNPLLKRTRTNINWTPEMLDEWIKCSEDPIYFAENYIQIVHIDRGLIPIQLYDYQKEIIEKITKNRRVAVLTARQAGKCLGINTIVKVRNKNSGQIFEITMGELYESKKLQK